jgi:hypothetical protein
LEWIWLLQIPRRDEGEIAGEKFIGFREALVILRPSIAIWSVEDRCCRRCAVQCAKAFGPQRDGFRWVMRLIEMRGCLCQEAIMPWAIKRTLLWSGAALLIPVLLFCVLVAYPDPLFAFSLGSGWIVVSSDRPIPSVGGERFLHDCERLLERSPLKAKSRRYRVYVTNEDWRQRLFFLWDPKPWGLAYGLGGTAFLSGANFETGRVVHRGYVGTPPRTLAWLCAHELTHLIAYEHLGLARFRMPQWAFEGLADYVGIENRESFEQLREALGDRPVDIPMMVQYGSYPRYRLLVTFFIEKKGWSADQLLHTRLTVEEANEIMRADVKR